MSRVKLELNELDSARYFSDISYKLARESGSIRELESVAFISSIVYEKTGNYSEALKKYKEAQDLKDSIQRKENIKSILGYQLKTELEARQRAIEEEKKKKEEALQSRKRLQYLGIFTFILFLLTTFMVIRRMRVPLRFVDNIGFISVLLLFQFIETVINPYIDLYSFGNPIVFMIINLSIASMVKPLHDFIERKVFKGSRRDMAIGSDLRQ